MDARQFYAKEKGMTACMGDFDKMRKTLLEAAKNNRLEETAEKLKNEVPKDEQKALDSLLHPERYGPVVQLSDCVCADGEAKCELHCLFDGIKRDKDGKLIVSTDCAGCGLCIEDCENHVLAGRVDLIPLMKLLAEHKTPVYAMIAPAFSGQFSEKVTAGKLRSAFKAAGFYGMIEVALFADILTLKEALEFDRAIQDDNDFIMTSCCCPMWVALIKKKYASLIPHVPPSVSPMVACGRSIKHIHPEAVTVFIGPCIAKKAEAREEDIKDAVDYVLTFQETAELFEVCGIDPAEMPEDESDHSSKGGRIYAKTGGVSEAVKSTVERLNPHRKIALKAQQADGIVDCKKMLLEIEKGNINANFIEGMGCKGGCIGGPKRIIPVDEAREHINNYAKSASCKTPADNPHVLMILQKLGFDTLESLLDRDNIFIRQFK